MLVCCFHTHTHSVSSLTTGHDTCTYIGGTLQVTPAENGVNEWMWWFHKWLQMWCYGRQLGELKVHMQVRAVAHIRTVSAGGTDRTSTVRSVTHIWNWLLQMIMHKVSTNAQRLVTGAQDKTCITFQFAIIWLWEEYTGEDLPCSSGTHVRCILSICGPKMSYVCSVNSTTCYSVCICPYAHTYILPCRWCTKPTGSSGRCSGGLPAPHTAHCWRSKSVTLDRWCTTGSTGRCSGGLPAPHTAHCWDNCWSGAVEKKGTQV